MEATEILEKAKKVVKKGWCQKVSARNKNGKPVICYSKEACRFCTTGAIAKVAGLPNMLQPGRTLAEAFYYLMEAKSAQPNLSLTEWNDVKGRTKRQVLFLYDRAIALSKQ